MGYYSTIRKDILLFATTSMALEGIILIRERQMLYELSDTWNLKPKLMATEKRLVVPRAKGEGMGEGGEGTNSQL